jgi:glycosyltransferase involved in cell wall biosynthesis
MPNTVIEAYAYGKPVVASKVGSLAEIVEDGKTGFLFEMKNSKDFSYKLAQFISDKNLSKTMGIEARRKCENEYNTEKHMKNVLRILGEN